MTLFDDIKRQDFNRVLDEPQRNVRYSESSFNYLNLYDSPDIIRIRNLLESSFNRFPLEAQNDLRKRLQSHDYEQHEGAFFELFLHELLTRLGCTIVDVHPKIAGAGTRPDFLVRHGDQCFYLEATMVGKRSGPFTLNLNEQDVINKLNKLKSSQFYIRVCMNVDKLSRTLGKKDVIRPFIELLKNQDPDKVQDLINTKGLDAAPCRKIEDGNWSLQGWLYPISPKYRRSTPPSRIVIYPSHPEQINSVSPIRDALKTKAKKYGDNAEMLVVAVSTRDAFYNHRNHDMEVLFGQEQWLYSKEQPDFPPLLQRRQNGVWPSYNQIGAVWSFQKADALNLSQVSACLYINPWSNDSEIPDALYRLTHAKGCDGEMKWFEGEDIVQLVGVSRN